MKKYITAPISSAIIIPGFGQILNGQLKKGLMFMGVVFVIFAAGLIKLIQMAMDLMPELERGEIDIEDIQAKLNSSNDTVLTIIIFIFLIVWAYSIIDAFIYGIRIEKEGEHN